MTSAEVESTVVELPSELRQRYKVQSRIGEDAFTTWWSAIEVHGQPRVLLRVIRPGLLDVRQATTVVGRLRQVVGAGGRYLPGLIDVEQQNSYVILFEPWPEGTSLRERIRSTPQTPMAFEDVMMISAQLAAAIQAIPPPWHHGDVRPECIWIRAEGIQLVAPFLIPSLPLSAITAALQKNEPERHFYAPELYRGSCDDNTDRFGVAATVLELLGGRAYGELTIPPTLGDIGEALRALLISDPTRREPTLTPLLSALAHQAKAQAPTLSSGAFRRPRRVGVVSLTGNDLSEVFPARVSSEKKIDGHKPRGPLSDDAVTKAVPMRGLASSLPERRVPREPPPQTKPHIQSDEPAHPGELAREPGNPDSVPTSQVVTAVVPPLHEIIEEPQRSLKSSKSGRRLVGLSAVICFVMLSLSATVRECRARTQTAEITVHGQ